MKVISVTPQIALPGGVVRVELEGTVDPGQVEVEVGGVEAEVVGASPSRLTIKVPEDAESGISVHGEEEAQGDLIVGQRIDGEVHSVSNPVVDAKGDVYVTFSGARGEKVAFSVYVVHPDGEQEPFLAEITNPTGLAMGPDGCLYITSRHTGTAYRSTLDKQVEKYADGLGLATGLVFDSMGNLLVGDRSGTIRRVSPKKELSELCHLEPSVSAYHLAIDDQDRLYVSGPTLSTQDSVYRISPSGEVESLFRGFGRPQGLALDPRGRLQITASFRGRKGVFTLHNGVPEWTVSGPMLVGLAYSPDGKLLYLTDNSSLYRVELG